MSSRPPIPTLAEMAASCRANAEAAQFQVRRCQKGIDTLQPSKEREGLKLEIWQHIGEAEHWKNYAGYYDRRAQEEGPGVRPRLRWMMDGPAEPSRSREPGEDDV